MKSIKLVLLVWCAIFVFWLLDMAVVLSAAADTVVISFEQEEGFPAATNDSSFNDLSTNKGVVVTWTVRNPEGANYFWGMDDGPGGVRFPEAPAPISGTQIGGLITAGGNGISVGTMDLDKKANLTLTGLYWAYRGQGDSRPGGNAYLELEYFDLNGKSIGKEKFQGGLNPDWSPKFDLARVSPQFQSAALSRVIFRGVPSIPANEHGTFFLDDVALSAPGDKSISTPTESEVSRFKQVDTAPPMVRLPSPLPDSTVSGNPTISVDFADVGSGIKISSAKLLVDGKDVTSQGKVTAEGVTLNLKSPLEKGIHRVEVTVSDNAGNMGNRQSWQFGVDMPVVVKAEFKEAVFMVNDEPYFPMGMYTSIEPYARFPDPKKDLLRAQASAAGINCILMSESTDLPSLDIMLKVGMKAIKLVGAAIGRISETDKAPMISMANATKDHPAMLAWSAFDPETIGPQGGNMAMAYKILKEQDPNHPVIWCADSEKAIESEDACFQYMNPIGWRNQRVKSIEDVVLRKVFAVANPKGKHVWFMTQAIDMRIVEGEKIEPEDFRPNAAEIRAMNYFCMAKGVKGLFYAAQSGSPTPGVYSDLTEYPSQWQEAMKIASEVRYLSTVLAAGKPAQTARIEPENAAIHYGEIEHEGMKTLIAVNVADTPVTVTWRFPNLVQPVVLFEDRMLSEKAKEITDMFKPLEVHIYRWM